MKIYHTQESFYDAKLERIALHDIKYILLEHSEGTISTHITQLVEKKDRLLVISFRTLLKYLKKHYKIHGIRNKTFKRLKQYYRQGWRWLSGENCRNKEKIYKLDTDVRLDQFILAKEIKDIRKSKGRTYSIIRKKK